MLGNGWNGAPQWILHQVAWWCCVLGPEPWGLAAMALFLAIHLFFNGQNLAAELGVIFAALAMGVVVDGSLAYTGQVHYEGLQRVLGIPLWMLALWAGFGATLRHSQRLLVSSPARAVLVGALGGPMAYGGGERLGRMAVEGGQGYFVVGLTWAMALGALAVMIPVRRC